MRPHLRRGATLIELMVAVFVVGIILAFLVTSVRNARKIARRVQCLSNMRIVGLGLNGFLNAKNRYPNAGTFYDDPAIHQGDPLKSTIDRAITNPGGHEGDAELWLYSWINETIPHLESSDFHYWDKQKSYLNTVETTEDSGFTNSKLANMSISLFTCPDDLTLVSDQGNLSYVVNGGFSRWHAIPVGWSGSPTDGGATHGEVLQWAGPNGTWRENLAIAKKLGVMFLGTHTGDQPWDIKTTAADIADGTSNTLLLGENTLAGYSAGTKYSGGHATNYACPLPNFSMFLASDNVCHTPRSTTDCQGGQLRPDAKGASGPGWKLANQAGTFENMNYGQKLTIEGSFPFANSGHEGGSNFIFCDGSGRFISDSIDGSVYASLISPAGTLLPPQIRQSQYSGADLEQ